MLGPARRQRCEDCHEAVASTDLMQHMARQLSFAFRSSSDSCGAGSSAAGRRWTPSHGRCCQKVSKSLLSKKPPHSQAALFSLVTRGFTCFHRYIFHYIPRFLRTLQVTWWYDLPQPCAVWAYADLRRAATTCVLTRRSFAAGSRKRRMPR